ncbi:MAG: class I SAM-dependent methyltransferase [Frankiaceae bacterium]|nr:class I SAM-dependent methyltransferase [Frankiaceae bacterium]
MAKYGITVGYLSMFAPRAEILDVGCGPGSLRHYLQPGAFRRYVGVDNSPHAIDVAQTSFDDPETSFVLADDIPSDLQPFSAVVMLDVLYHVEEPMRTIQRVKEVTQPDGIVIASHWRHPGEWMLLDMLDREFERLDVVTFENHRDQILSPLGHRISCHRRVG